MKGFKNPFGGGTLSKLRSKATKQLGSFTLYLWERVNFLSERSELRKLGEGLNQPLSLTLSLGERTTDVIQSEAKNLCKKENFWTKVLKMTDIKNNRSRIKCAMTKGFTLAARRLGIPAQQGLYTTTTTKPTPTLPNEGGSKAAFTLAEVLITLGIIGVVAVLTISQLVENYQKKVTVESLKTAYSIFSQAVAQSVEDNGPISTWKFSYSDMAPKYIFPYVETIGVVEKYKLLSLNRNGNSFNSFIHWGGWTTGKIYAIKNGMTYSLIYDHDALTLTVDINGPKGPNRLGRDGFCFELLIKENKLILSGANKSKDDIINGGCKMSDWSANYYMGQYCGALIMISGWQITSDYPW